MYISYYGHSCFMLEISGSKLIIDPFINQNPKASAINADKIEADFILLTHGHFDHVADAELIGKNSNATIISNFEIVSWFEKKGVKGHPMNFGGKMKFDFGMAKYVVASHSSALPDGSNGGNPGGFVVWNDDICFYHAGDTSVTMDMQLIPRTCPPLDFAILPIGDNFTMGYEEAIVAAALIECDRIIGCHYDSFEVIEIDHETAITAFKDAGKELILMNIGERREI